MTGSLTRPIAKTGGFETPVVGPKSNANAIVVQPFLMERKFVSDVFANFPVDAKPPRATS